MALSSHIDIDQILQKAEKETKRDFKKRDPHLNTLAYSGRYVRQEVPKFEMPEKPMDASAAYHIIHDQLILDGNSSQNMATFVTSWMEPEAQKLLIESFGKNFADKDEYPKTVELQDRCVNMLARLWNCNSKDEKPVGTATIGSSEAFTLGALAAKMQWRSRRQKEGKSSDKPNIVFGHNAHVALKKFARYFDVEVREVLVSEESGYVMDAKLAVAQCDENTIAVISILGSTFNGTFENVKELSDELDKLQKEKGVDVPIHIDGASGAFVAPFVFPNCIWDFRLPRVKSINASGHKYGLVYPGVGWIVFRDASALPEELIFHIDYLGDDDPTYTINFSRGSSQVVGQYYNFLRLGKEGYKDIMENCIENAKFFSHCLLDSKYFTLRSRVHEDGFFAVPVIAFSLNTKGKEYGFDEYDVSREIRKFGWIVPAYKLPPSCDTIIILRVVVRELHSKDFLDELFTDLIKTVESLMEADQRNSKQDKPTKTPSTEKPESKRANGTSIFTSVC